MYAKERDIRGINATMENRREILATIASMVFDKESSKDPTRLYKRLMGEAVGNEIGVKAASRPFEFIPVIFKILPVVDGYSLCDVELLQTAQRGTSGRIELQVVATEQFAVVEEEVYENMIQPFTYKKDGVLYSNFRALINAGIPEEDIPLMNESVSGLYEDYRVIEAYAPMFVWAQFRTHGRMSMLSQSDRLVERNEYWLPTDFRDKVYSYVDKQTDDEMNPVAIKITNSTFFHISKAILESPSHDGVVDVLLKGTNAFKLSQQELLEFFKVLGYKREIYQRALYYFKLKKFIIGGWKTDPNTWIHLALERTAGWTQGTSKDFAGMIIQELKL